RRGMDCPHRHGPGRAGSEWLPERLEPAVIGILRRIDLFEADARTILLPALGPHDGTAGEADQTVGAVGFRPIALLFAYAVAFRVILVLGQRRLGVLVRAERHIVHPN